MPTYTFNVGTGDGRVRLAGQSTWDLAHNTATGGNAYPSEENVTASSGADATPTFTINRGFLPIPSVVVPAGYRVISARFYGYTALVTDNDNDASAYVVLVGATTQASPTTLVVGDYDECSSVHSPSQVSNQLDLSSMSVGTWIYWDLNAAGLALITNGWVLLGMREGHDVDDHAPDASKSSILQIRSADYSDVTKWPYLEVVMTPDINLQVGEE